MAINQLTTANTFQQWLVATQSLIGVANNLTDGTGGTFYANTNMVVGGDLTVTGNITLDSIGFNDMNVAGNLYVGVSITGPGANALVDTATAQALAFSIALG